MKRTSRQLKYWAKNAMSGHTGMLILSCVLVEGANWLSSSLTSALFDGSNTVSIILGMLFQFILSLLIGVFSAGLSYLMLNISRRREFAYGDLLYFFRNHPDRVIVAGFVLALLQVFSNIPLYIVTYAVPVGDTLNEMMTWLELELLAMVAGIVLNLLLSLPFVLTYYCLADDLDLEGFAALKESMRLMKGNKWRYVKLQISFIPILLLSVFTLYLALLWIIPYMEMTSTAFYRDILGEYDVQDGSGYGGYTPPNTPYPGGRYWGDGDFSGWNQGTGGQDSHSGDDYNSEA